MAFPEGRRRRGQRQRHLTELSIPLFALGTLLLRRRSVAFEDSLFEDAS